MFEALAPHSAPKIYSFGIISKAFKGQERLTESLLVSDSSVDFRVTQGTCYFIVNRKNHIDLF
jgi:hypothetical protein